MIAAAAHWETMALHKLCSVLEGRSRGRQRRPPREELPAPRATETAVPLKAPRATLGLFSGLSSTVGGNFATIPRGLHRGRPFRCPTSLHRRSAGGFPVPLCSTRKPALPCRWRLRAAGWELLGSQRGAVPTQEPAAIAGCSCLR